MQRLTDLVLLLLQLRMSAPPSPNRPRTATAGVPDLISSDSSDLWSVGSDDDPGMFSFLPPSPNSPPHRDSFAVPIQDTSTPRTPPSTSAQSTPSRSRHPLLQTPPDTAGLSPAAAYARAAQRHLGADGGWVQGARKRGSWQALNTPAHVVGESIREQQDRKLTADSKVVSFQALRAVRTGETAHSTSTGRAWSSSEYDTEMRNLGSKGHGDRDQPYKYGGDESGDERGTTANLSYFDGAEEDSPFAEVRASVSNLDDPEMPCLTFRSMFLGIFFCVVFGAINCFFYLR